MKNFSGFGEQIRERSCTDLFESVPGNKNYKSNKFISVVYSKGATIYEKSEKWYKLVKMLEVRSKRTAKIKWDFGEMVSLIHDLLMHKGKLNIF
jgi:hypothetical protein